MMWPSGDCQQVTLSFFRAGGVSFPLSIFFSHCTLAATKSMG